MPRVEGIHIIDVDTHFTEPHDLWTARAPQKFAERVPQVRTVEGFFIYPDELTAEPELMLILNSAPGGVEPYVHVSVPVGTGPNQVEPPPAEASDQDLRVHTASGEVADMTGRVRVTGTVTAGDMGDGTTCFLDEPTISLPADVNPVP